MTASWYELGFQVQKNRAVQQPDVRRQLKCQVLQSAQLPYRCSSLNKHPALKIRPSASKEGSASLRQLFQGSH